MPKVLIERDQPFIQRLREGPTSALEHLRALYLSREPGLISKGDELATCARDLLVHLKVLAKRSNDPDVIARAMDPELRRACFDSEILLLFADIMADHFFLKHFPVCHSSCILTSAELLTT